MGNRIDRLRLTALTTAVLFLPIVLGCSGAKQTERSDTLSHLASLSPLPKGVSLAPGTGSDKVPWMTSNPFLSVDRQILGNIEEQFPVNEGDLKEICLAAYWIQGPDGSAVEMDLTALCFKDAAVASQVAKTVQSSTDEGAGVEPDTTPAIISQGNTVCVLSRTSAVDRDVWSAMVHLVENALTHVP
jgi:hypothetical protein